MTWLFVIHKVCQYSIPSIEKNMITAIYQVKKVWSNIFSTSRETADFIKRTSDPDPDLEKKPTPDLCKHFQSQI